MATTMNWFHLRRHATNPSPVSEAKTEYWYEVIESVRAFPLAVAVERHVCVTHSETTGRIIVDELNNQRRKGVIEGMTRFAWWKDGVEMVGTCGTTLKKAIEEVEGGKW